MDLGNLSNLGISEEIQPMYTDQTGNRKNTLTFYKHRKTKGHNILEVTMVFALKNGNNFALKRMFLHCGIVKSLH